jgi:hypothetical protein
MVILLGMFSLSQSTNDLISFAGYFDLSRLEALRILTYADQSQSPRLNVAAYPLNARLHPLSL